MKKVAKQQERAEGILLTLKTLGMVSRSQIQIINELGSIRTTFRAMEDVKEYVNKYRDGETIYYLNAEGRKLVDSKKVMKKTTTAQHYIMRNDLYIALGCPEGWKNEQRIKAGGITVVCDAYCEINNAIYIIEVDHTQKMSANKSKIEKYRKLYQLGVFPKPVNFLWITTTKFRKESLEAELQGLEHQVFTITDFH